MMKRKTLWLVVTAVLVGLAGASYYFLFYNVDKAGNSVADNTFGWKFPTTKFPLAGSGGDIAYSKIRNKGGIPEGLPVRLQIPAIGVDSTIEDALITPDGRMDVPAGSKNVAWFSLGPHPGEVGSAVIGGHFGISGGVPFVFYNLDKLRVGDKLYVVNDRGETLAFAVRSIKLFSRDSDATSVFTSDDGLAHLNLITCEGIWNRVNDTYPERRVVFADAIDAETPAVSVAPQGTVVGQPVDALTFPRIFGRGASGSDVAALQVFFEQRGLLVMPAGVARGFFGLLTSSATSKYQASAGLPQAGVFGPLTRAKVLAELRADTALPDAGAGGAPSSGGAEAPPAPLQTFLDSIKSLYATPLNGIITTALLALIVFVAFKIIRR